MQVPIDYIQAPIDYTGAYIDPAGSYTGAYRLCRSLYIGSYTGDYTGAYAGDCTGTYTGDYNQGQTKEIFEVILVCSLLLLLPQ